MQDYQRHRHWTRMNDFEQGLVHLLFASQGRHQALPFRADQKIGEPIIVAAESWAAEEQPLLVVALEEHLEMWSEFWDLNGERFCEGPHVVGSKSVNFATVEELQEDLWQGHHYGTVVLAYSYTPQEVKRLTRLLSYDRMWWVAPQGVEAPWPLGAAGEYLLKGGPPQPVRFEPRPLLRPSALAERLAIA